MRSFFLSFLYLQIFYNTYVFAAYPYYRSRFHWDYFPKALDHFKVVQPSGKIPNIDAVIKVLEVILPYELPDTSSPQEQKQLGEAHQWKLGLITSFINSSQVRLSLYNDDKIAKRFVRTILANVLGEEDELLRPEGQEGDVSIEPDFFFKQKKSSRPQIKRMEKPISILNYEEPAVGVFLGEFFDFVIDLYVETDRCNFLWYRLHNEETLYGLAKLFYSPDEWERQVISTLFETILHLMLKNIAEDSCVSPSNFVIVLIGQILRTLAENFYEKYHEINARPIKEIIKLSTQYFYPSSFLYNRFLQTSNKKFMQRLFCEIYLDVIVPLIDQYVLVYAGEEYKDSLKVALSAARSSKESDYWYRITNRFIDSLYKNADPRGLQSENNRLQIIFHIIMEKLFMGKKLPELFLKLFDHFVNCDHIKVQQSFLAILGRQSFREMLNSRMTMYLFVVIFKNLLYWYLFLEESHSLSPKLLKTINLWLKYPGLKGNTEVDDELTKLLKRAQQRIERSPFTETFNTNFSFNPTLPEPSNHQSLTEGKETLSSYVNAPTNDMGRVSSHLNIPSVKSITGHFSSLLSQNPLNRSYNKS